MYTDEFQIECFYQCFQDWILSYQLLEDSFVGLHFEQIIGYVVSLFSLFFVGMGFQIIEHLHFNSIAVANT